MKTRSESFSAARSRRRLGPFLVLGCAVLLPALVLAATHRWASARIVEAEPLPPPPTTTSPPPAALTTPLLTVRRMSTIVSRKLSIEGFRSELNPFLGSLNDRSCVAVSVDGQAVGSRNADLAVIPASTQKLLVAAVALEELGEDFRYTTRASAASQPTAGVLEGDLFLVGGGDPLLTSDWYPTSNLERYPVTSPTRLDALADEVRAAGITTVTGNIVGDATRYDDEYFVPGWGAGVAGLEAGPYDALMANDSRVVNDPLKSNDPAEGAAREFIRMLTERGVTVQGEATTGVAPAGAYEIAAIDSAPLGDVVGEMLDNSDNNTSELMVKELGYAATGIGTRQAGLEVMAQTLAEWSVATDQLVLVDGSGLSPDNRATCAALLAVLQRSDPDGPIGTGLPIAATTGTLSDVFVDHPLAGKLTGKTGTLNNPPFNVDPPAVKSLAGYVGIDGGSTIEYALVLNGPTISDQSEYRAIWTDLADVLATYPAGPTPSAIGVR